MDFQYEVFMPGTTRLNPESVVVRIWDYDPEWSVEWREGDGPAQKMNQVEEYSPLHAQELNEVYKEPGRKPAIHKVTRAVKNNFAATPSAGAKEITILIRNRFGKVWEEKIEL